MSPPAALSPIGKQRSFASISGADFRSHHGRLSIASPVIIIAQIMRAILLASATAAILDARLREQTAGRANRDKLRRAILRPDPQDRTKLAIQAW